MSTSIKFKLRPNAIKNIVNRHSFTVNCPNCKNPVSFLGSQVGTLISCPMCRKTIRLVDNSYSSGINHVQKDFERIGK